MSDLYRSAIHARLSKLPPMPPPEDLEDGDEEEEEADSLGSLPSMPPPPTSLPRPGSGSTSAKPSYLDGFKPISASGYFDQALEINVPSAQLDFRVYYTPPKAKGGTVLVCHHGAGYSALSFACFAKEVTRFSNGECGVLAFDVRRHGMHLDCLIMTPSHGAITHSQERPSPLLSPKRPMSMRTST